MTNKTLMMFAIMAIFVAMAMPALAQPVLIDNAPIVPVTEFTNLTWNATDFSFSIYEYGEKIGTLATYAIYNNVKQPYKNLSSGIQNQIGLSTKIDKLISKWKWQHNVTKINKLIELGYDISLSGFTKVSDTRLCNDKFCVSFDDLVKAGFQIALTDERLIINITAYSDLTVLNLDPTLITTGAYDYRGCGSGYYTISYPNLAIQFSNTSIMYVGTKYYGTPFTRYFKSSDAGATWTSWKNSTETNFAMGGGIVLVFANNNVLTIDGKYIASNSNDLNWSVWYPNGTLIGTGIWSSGAAIDTGVSCALENDSITVTCIWEYGAASAGGQVGLARARVNQTGNLVLAPQLSTDWARSTEYPWHATTAIAISSNNTILYAGVATGGIKASIGSIAVFGTPVVVFNATQLTPIVASAQGNNLFLISGNTAQGGNPVANFYNGSTWKYGTTGINITFTNSPNTIEFEHTVPTALPNSLWIITDADASTKTVKATVYDSVTKTFISPNKWLDVDNFSTLNASATLAHVTAYPFIDNKIPYLIYNTTTGDTQIAIFYDSYTFQPDVLRTYFYNESAVPANPMNISRLDIIGTNLTKTLINLPEAQFILKSELPTQQNTTISGMTSNNYERRRYMYITNDTNQNLTMYFPQTANLYTIYIKASYMSIANALITVSLLVDNDWKIIAEYLTQYDGSAFMYFQSNYNHKILITHPSYGNLSYDWAFTPTTPEMTFYYTTSNGTTLAEIMSIYNQVVGNCTSNNATATVACTYNDSSAHLQTMYLSVQKLSNVSWTSICANSSASSNGTMTCSAASAGNGTYYYWLYGKFASSTTLTIKIADGSFTVGLINIFGTAGLLFSAILIIALVMIGSFNPVVTVFMGIVGLVASSVLGMLDISLAALVGIIIVGIIIAIKSRG